MAHISFYFFLSSILVESLSICDFNNQMFYKKIICTFPTKPNITPQFNPDPEILV